MASVGQIRTRVAWELIDHYCTQWKCSSKFEPAQSWWERMSVGERRQSNSSESCNSHPRCNNYTRMAVIQMAYKMISIMFILTMLRLGRIHEQILNKNQNKMANLMLTNFKKFSGAVYESMSLQRRIMPQPPPNLFQTFATDCKFCCTAVNWFIRRPSAISNLSIN
jgi:hypothetical protein